MMALVGLLMVPAVAASAGVKVDVCHAKGNGNLNLINISENAFEKHIKHGDAEMGDPGPGMDGYVFGANCLFVVANTAPIAHDQTFTTTSAKFGGTLSATDPEGNALVDWTVQSSMGLPYLNVSSTTGEFKATCDAKAKEVWFTWTVNDSPGGLTSNVGTATVECSGGGTPK